MTRGESVAAAHPEVVCTLNRQRPVWTCPKYPEQCQGLAWGKPRPARVPSKTRTQADRCCGVDLLDNGRGPAMSLVTTTTTCRSPQILRTTVRARRRRLDTGGVYCQHHHSALVLVKDFSLSYNNKESILFTIDPH